jgi:hypothetical protein
MDGSTELDAYVSQEAQVAVTICAMLFTVYCFVATAPAAAAPGAAGTAATAKAR